MRTRSTASSTSAWVSTARSASSRVDLGADHEEEIHEGPQVFLVHEEAVQSALQESVTPQLGAVRGQLLGPSSGPTGASPRRSRTRAARPPGAAPPALPDCPPREQRHTDPVRVSLRDRHRNGPLFDRTERSCVHHRPATLPETRSLHQTNTAPRLHPPHPALEPHRRPPPCSRGARALGGAGRAEARSAEHGPGVGSAFLPALPRILSSPRGWAAVLDLMLARSPLFRGDRAQLGSLLTAGVALAWRSC